MAGPLVESNQFGLLCELHRHLNNSLSERTDQKIMTALNYLTQIVIIIVQQQNVSLGDLIKTKTFSDLV